MKALRQFLSDIHRMAQDLTTIATCIAANRTQDVNVNLNSAQLDLLNTPRRRRSKKGDA